jgi:hypothetical protein
MLKMHVEYDRDTSPAKLMEISRQVYPATLLGVFGVIWQRALVDESGMIIT